MLGKDREKAKKKAKEDFVYSEGTRELPKRGRAMSGEKLIRIRFSTISSEEERLVRRYLNDALLKKTARVDELGKDNLRQDVRVFLGDPQVKVITEPTEKLPMQTFMATLKDISTGGACIDVSETRKVAKNGQIELFLDFIQQGFTMKGVILGKK